jgi:fatty acid desaturase
MKHEEWETLQQALDEPVSAWPSLAVLAGDALALVLGWKLAGLPGLACTAGFVLTTLAMAHLYLLQHETIHQCVFRTGRANRLLGRALSFALVYPFAARQQAHLAHHRWTGHPEGDPTNRRLIAGLGALSPAVRQRMDLLWKLWWPQIALREQFALCRSTWQAGRPRGKARFPWLPCALGGYLLLIAALAANGVLGEFLLWYLPSWLGLQIVIELINLPHHSESQLIDDSRPYEFWRQAEVTHSCRSIPIWSSVCLLNFNLHTAHHLFPTVPWYRLPRADRLLRAADPAAREETENEILWHFRRRRGSFLTIYRNYLAAAQLRSARLAAIDPALDLERYVFTRSSDPAAATQCLAARREALARHGCEAAAGSPEAEGLTTYFIALRSPSDGTLHASVCVSVPIRRRGLLPIVGVLRDQSLLAQDDRYGCDREFTAEFAAAWVSGAYRGSAAAACLMQEAAALADSLGAARAVTLCSPQMVRHVLAARFTVDLRFGEQGRFAYPDARYLSSVMVRRRPRPLRDASAWPEPYRERAQEQP